MNEVAKIGRPKGSKNEVTLLKVAMEYGVRSNNIDKIKQILDGILDDALAGDRDCRKLVWQSVMSKAGSEQQQMDGIQPQITLRVERDTQVKVVEFIDATPIEVKEPSNEDPDLGQSSEGPRPVGAEERTVVLNPVGNEKRRRSKGPKAEEGLIQP